MTCIQLPEKPCIVKYLDDCDKYLIGTYEQELDERGARNKYAKLVNKTDRSEEEEVRKLWKKLNGRFGSLIVLENSIESPKITTTPCIHGGGVFDLYAINVGPRVHKIFVPHSNGYLGCYIYENDVISLQAVHKVDKSDSLTCIDVTTMKNSDKLCIAVGDSEGRVSVLDESGNLLAFRYTHLSQYSVWQVKFCHIEWLNKILLLVTIDDSMWFAYNYDEGELIPIYKSSVYEFNYGITSITFLRQNRMTSPTDDLLLLMGSYDMTIKLYSISASYGHDIAIRPRMLGETTIENSGIWRIKSVDLRKQDSDEMDYELYVAAMYAGSVNLKLNIKPVRTDEGVLSLDSKVNFEGLKRLDYKTEGTLEEAKEPLHYGIDISKKNSAGKQTCCVTDFNSRLCYLLHL